MATYKVIQRKKKVNKIGQAPIYVQYGHKEKTILFNTSVKVEPHYFSEKAPWINRVRPIKKIKANDLLIETYKSQDLSDNNTIAIKESTIKQAVQTKLINLGIDPTIERVRALFKPDDDPTEPKKKKSIPELYDEFLDTVDVRSSTFKHFKVTKTHLEGYLETFTGALTKDDVNYTFISGFNTYLIKSKSQNAGTANNHIKRIKRFANYLHNEQKKTAKDINLNKYNSEDQKKIFLEADELVKIYNYNLSDNPRLEKVRDLFCLSCCTSLRYSDVQRLRREHIKRDVITITHLKNNKKVEIPLFLFAKDIIEKYNGQFPVISNQKMNDYLKDLCELVEINEPIIIPTWRGKERGEDKVYKKYELISTHAGKKTFIMLAIENDMPIATLCAITGNSEKTLKHYYEIRNKNKIKHLHNMEASIMGTMKVS